jgi:hypothetical protein
MSVRVWQATKGGRGARVYIADPETRRIIRTMDVEFNKRLTDEQIFKVLKSQFASVFEDDTKAAIGG